MQMKGKLGWLMGIEPTTSGTTNPRSNQLSYSHHRGAVLTLGRPALQQQNGTKTTLSGSVEDEPPKGISPRLSDGKAIRLA